MKSRKNEKLASDMTQFCKDRVAKNHAQNPKPSAFRAALPGLVFSLLTLSAATAAVPMRKTCW